MLDWIVWYWTLFEIETVLKTVWQNWIAWNRNVFDN